MAQRMKRLLLAATVLIVFSGAASATNLEFVCHKGDEELELVINRAKGIVTTSKGEKFRVVKFADTSIDMKDRSIVYTGGRKGYDAAYGQWDKNNLIVWAYICDLK
jgi:hypothetical protein